MTYEQIANRIRLGGQFDRADIDALLAAIDKLTAEKSKLLDAVEVEYLERRRRGDAIGLLQAEVDDLEARNAKLEGVAEVDVRDMANFCIAQGASKPWQEIAHRLLAALDALDG